MSYYNLISLTLNLWLSCFVASKTPPGVGKIDPIRNSNSELINQPPPRQMATPNPLHRSTVASKPSVSQYSRYDEDSELLSTSVLPTKQSAPPQRAGQTRNANQQLLKRLFGNYIKEAMPDWPVVIHFDILLLKLKASLEKEGIFESVVGLFIEWKDMRMTWDPREYDNLTVLTFDADQIWLPDIAMTNSADHLYAISRDTRFVVRVTHEGMFKFVPTGTARTWCDLKLLTFPFDFQTCTLEFESWSMNSSAMTFDWHSQLILDSQFSSTEWALCQYRTLTYDHTYEFTNETFTRVEFEFIVKRKSTFYVINLIFPCATLSIIQLLVFLISSTDTTVDRIGFGTTNLLTLVVFQTIVTAEMPKTSDAVCALSKYIIALITISTVGIFESVVVERMLSTGLNPPHWLLLRALKYVPVLWREKPDPLKSDLKAVANDIMRRCDSSSRRFGVATGGRRSSLMAGTLARRVHHMAVLNASNESLNHIEEIHEVSFDNDSNFDEPLSFTPKSSTPRRQFGSLTGQVGRSPPLQRSPEDMAYLNQFKVQPIIPVDRMESQRRGSQSQANNVQTQNALMWTEVAYRIDFLTFITCASLALFIPMGLFGPLSLVNEQCADSAREFRNHPRYVPESHEHTAY